MQDKELNTYCYYCTHFYLKDCKCEYGFIKSKDHEQAKRQGCGGCFEKRKEN